ncbi:MAG: eukaryotic-like serine/threonine-protein kinase [Acidobacteriota bacterium]|jgi:serine/threonine protein kinase|nr:eukaryotic-like serine/threonine-protein kinase [Acidobacteriota bacterium]
MSELKLQQCRLDGRYDVLDCLGRGSYSEVYVARDAAAQGEAPRLVVIKALNTHLQGMPDPELERTLIENFRNEAVALDRVRHPNIISRLGHGTAIDLSGRTFHYLVVEYLPGGDLQTLILRHPLPLDGALFYLEQVCKGLAHAHKHGVIHRDIKPQNLLLTADQHTIKIADFGVAKIEAAEGAITRVGTDVYAAPEHHPLAVTGPLDTTSLSRPRPAQLTPAADVYSLAKTTYMVLTGEAPRRFSQKPITQLPQEFAAEGWARYVLRVLERATQINPLKRHQTVEEFWRELRDATMAQTQPLRRPDGGVAGPGETDERGYRDDSGSRGFTPSPPPAPTFDRESRSANNTGRHRFVVPIAGAGPAAAAVIAQAESGASLSPRENIDVPAGAYTDHRPQTESRASRVPARVRKWGVALLLLLAFSGMLYATFRYVKNTRAGGDAQQRQQATTQSNRQGAVGSEMLTATDINLRKGPDTSYTKVGLAESGSRVKVLQVSGKWCQVQVIEHSRTKADPDSEDQGWVNSTLLKPKS